jgi:hypothetical protein
MPTLEELRGLDEDEFTKKVIKPLLEEMDYKGVRIIHGSKEYGKDIIFYTLGPFDNKRWGGVQLKVKDITGGMTQKGNFVEVSNQLETALEMPHPDMTSVDKVSITEVYLITSQSFTDNAKEALINKFSDKPVYFVDGETVLEKINKYDIPITDSEIFEKSITDAIEEEETPLIAEIAGEDYKLTPVVEDEEVS